MRFEQALRTWWASARQDVLARSAQARCRAAVFATLALLASLAAPAKASTERARSFDTCFDTAAQRYGLDGRLLRSIAQVESGMRPHAVNLEHRSRTGTTDLGLMQINSGWLPRLQAWGIGREQLLGEPCTNIAVGAWILSDLVARHGNSWDAVGAYNAACTQLKGDACRAARAQYTWKVWRAMSRHRAHDAPAAETVRASPASPPVPWPGLVSSVFLNDQRSPEGNADPDDSHDKGTGDPLGSGVAP